MPQNCQAPAAADPDADIILRTLGLRLPADHRIGTHSHDWPQLVYATEGVMSVETTVGTWVVPPERAVWIPAGFQHAVRMTGVVRMRTLYVRPRLLPALPASCCVIPVSPLLRELIVEVMGRHMLRDGRPDEARLARVLADQIVKVEEAPLRLPFPSDERARAVAQRALADLSTTPPLAALVEGSGGSARTIERVFARETGLTFGRWLRRARALRALELLADGESVTATGLAVGYDSTSAFIAMFKRVLGRTPGSRP